MNKVILQPCGNKDARKHYVDTIQNPVLYEIIARHLSAEDLSVLNEVYPTGKIPTWGVTPGKNNVNYNKWSKINVGDVTLFASNGQIFGSGVVTHKVHHRQLALQLWGQNSSDQTWEYIYFLDELKQHTIPYISFNQVVGYAENNIIQGFTVLDDDKSDRVLMAFDLKSEVYLPEVTLEEYRDAVNNYNPMGDLDIKSKGNKRKEQPFLRRQLFKNKKVAHCGICKKEYPVDLLVAAHIKKRAFCSREEKLDFENIVMPMCKFGCDDLYEKAYIVVCNGKIVRNHKKLFTSDLLERVALIENNECTFWNNNTREYFEWHSQQ